MLRSGRCGEFLFRASGRYPNVPDPLHRGFVSEGLDHSYRRVDCEAATRASNASCHLAVVASDVLLDLELSEASSPMGHGRLFPTPFGRTSNHHSSDSPDMLEHNWTSHPVCAQAGACACPFLRGATLTVRSGSGTIGQRARSSASAFPVHGRGVFLKKSASVVAKVSALMVTVFMCFSSASVFSRVSLMASLQIVSTSSSP